MAFDSTPVVDRTDPVHAFAGRALAVLDALVDSPAWAMTPAEQAEVLVGLARVEAGVTELCWRVLAAADRNEIGARGGHASTASWLASHTRSTRACAHGVVRGGLLWDEPRYARTREAFARGALSQAQVWVVLRAREDVSGGEVTDEQRGTAQEHLIGLAAAHDATSLRVLARRLLEVLAPDEADRREAEALEREERAARERCRFAMRDNGDGTTSGWFKLPGRTSPHRGAAAGRWDRGDRGGHPRPGPAAGGARRWGAGHRGADLCG